MARHPATIDISTPHDLAQVADEVAASGESRLLVRADEVVAIIQPVEQPEPATRRRRRKIDPADDPVLGLIGMLDAGEPTNIAQFKDQYIAEAVDRRRS